jgi:ParB-like chromosome segregation protein Spo0J
MLDLTEFLEEHRPSIKWSVSTGYHRCVSCGRQMDSTEKSKHWPKHCSLSKDKRVQKLRAQVLAENFPVEEKPEIKEAGLDWYQNQIKITENLPMDFRPTGAAINEDLYPSTTLRQNLGDLKPLIESIKRHGLLHPIVLSEDNQLICGRRRLAACMQLDLKEIEGTYTSSTDLREAEADENIVRKDFTVEEIAEIDEFYREREEKAAEQRQKAGKQIPVGSVPRGRARQKIAEKVGISDRQLEKIRTIKGDTNKEIWKKVASGKMKVDKGYNQIKRFQRIKEALSFVNIDLKDLNPSEIFDLQFGKMETLGENIPDNSIDLIFTDPPYNEASLSLYGDLARLADRVLRLGGSLVTFAGHYAIFKINDLIRDNSSLVYHWQIIVKHKGSKSRIHARNIWPYYKPLLWY